MAVSLIFLLIYVAFSAISTCNAAPKTSAIGYSLSYNAVVESNIFDKETMESRIDVSIAQLTFLIGVLLLYIV